MGERRDRAAGDEARIRMKATARSTQEIPFAVEGPERRLDKAAADQDPMLHEVDRSLWATQGAG